MNTYYCQPYSENIKALFSDNIKALFLKNIKELFSENIKELLKNVKPLFRKCKTAI
jgi:hypothetical protein